MNLADFIRLHAHRIWSDRTLRDNLNKLERVCRFEGYGERPLASIGASEVYQYLDSLHASGLSPATVNRYTACITAVFKLACEMRLVDHPIKISWQDEGKGRPRYMTKEELEKLQGWFSRDVYRPWMQHFVTLAVNTGMRMGEIRKVTPAMIKRHPQQAADSQQEWVHLEETKNGDERWVPLNDKARAALKALNDEPARHYKHRSFYNGWEEARRYVAPGDEAFVFHALRHTCATNLANDLNINTILIGKILGHRSEATTKKYVHEKPQALADIAQALMS